MKTAISTYLQSKKTGLWLIILTTLLSLFFQLQPDSWMFSKSTYIEKIWLLISAHFTHFDSQHLLWNIIALWLMAFLWIEEFTAADWLLLLLVQPLFFIPWLISSDWQYYAGLSGCLHGVFLYGLLRYGYHPVSIKWIMIIILMGKLLFEQLGGGSLMSIQGSWRVAVDAHLIGAISGLLLALPWLIRRR